MQYFEKKGETPVDTGRYQRLVEKLIYLAHTQPNMSFPVSVFSQFMHAPVKNTLKSSI